MILGITLKYPKEQVLTGGLFAVRSQFMQLTLKWQLAVLIAKLRLTNLSFPNENIIKGDLLNKFGFSGELIGRARSFFIIPLLEEEEEEQNEENYLL